MQTSRDHQTTFSEGHKCLHKISWQRYFSPDQSCPDWNISGLFEHAHCQSETNPHNGVCGRCMTNVGKSFLSCQQTFSSFCSSARYHGFVRIGGFQLTPLDALNFPSLKSHFEKVACISWSINRRCFCLCFPGRMAALMKLLNEAERAHLCSRLGDHACRWQGQRR